MSIEAKLYKAVVWSSKEEGPGIRIELMAASLEEAEKALKAKYGLDVVYSLYSEEEANLPR